MHSAPEFSSQSLQLQTAVTPMLLSQQSPPARRALQAAKIKPHHSPKYMQRQKTSLAIPVTLHLLICVS